MNEIYKKMIRLWKMKKNYAKIFLRHFVQKIIV